MGAWPALLGAGPQTETLPSNDSDLAGAVSIVRNDLKKVAGILNPQRRASRMLAQAATFLRQIRGGVLGASRFASPLIDANGTFHKPVNW